MNGRDNKILRRLVVLFLIIAAISLAKWVIDVDNEMPEYHRTNPDFHYKP